jgi:DNA-binding transcriptional regulator LsrR (DeoR family)
VGDIGGIIIPRRGLPKAEANRIKEMNDRWTGIQEHHLQRCAREASKNGRPGVVIVALGQKRCDMVRRCVELGLVNELIIDQELAQGLKEGPATTPDS